MHPYSINSEEHKRIHLCIAILSIFLAWSIDIVEIPWWIESPSVIGFYGVLYTVFDKYLWKKRFFRFIGGIKTPILEGDWSGKILSSSKHALTPIAIKKFRIKQTWSRISFFLATETSESYSFVASMTIDQFDTPRIHYQYRNDPKENSPKTMYKHCGSVIAKVISDNEIEAEYYSDRDRKNTGSFTLKKK